MVFWGGENCSCLLAVKCEEGCLKRRAYNRHLAAEVNVEHVFSRAGQLSEVNLDPDALAGMVFIMVIKLAYKPSVKDIMDKYNEMFRGKNTANKKGLFQQSRQPPTTRTRTRTQMGELD